MGRHQTLTDEEDTEMFENTLHYKVWKKNAITETEAITLLEFVAVLRNAEKNVRNRKVNYWNR